MDLAELKFVVKTEQLDEAATKIEALGVAVSKLNKPIQDLNKESAKTNKELSKAEEAAAKAALAQHKLEQAQGKSAETIGKSTSLLERHNLIVEYQAKGYSKGQASIMATAKASGALDDVLKELGNTLKLQRTLMGTDPFDKSIGLMQKLQNETRITSEVNNLFNRNLGLTEKQMIELAREKERLIALYGIEGRDIKELAGEYDELIRKSVMLNQTNDARTKGMRDQIKQQNDAAKASAYLANEMDRVNRLTESNGNITSATNNRLIRFEKELKASGASASEAATKLEAYKAALLSSQKAAGNRQIDYLSRALGPQITDIGVGLATGQAPLTILLQQGGQLRDQFALAGVAGSEMGKMLVQASKAMVTSIKDIGLAVGQLVTGAIAGTGKAIIDGVIAPFKRLSEGKEALKQLEDGLISNLRYTRLLEVANGRLTQSIVAMSKVAGTVALIGVAMLAKGLYDVIKQQDQLTTQLVLTGASLGVNTAQATSYANSLNAVGVTTNSALKVIAAMAKEGGFLANEITMVVTAANNLKFAGVAIEDTVKQFAKLKEKPVEALIEIAKATGLVKPEIVALVSELQQQGKTSEAAAIAMKAYADVTVTQKDRLKQELSGFAVFMKTLSSGIGEFFDEVFRGLWRKASPTEAIKREIKELENTIKVGTEASPQTKARNEATLATLKEQLRLSQMASDAETTRSSDNIRTAKALGEWQQLSVANLDKEKKAELDIANIRKVGLDAKKSEAEIEKLIADYREKNKPAKTAAPPMTDAEKERLRLLKESEKYLSRISSLNNQAIKEQEDYTKAQKLALDIFSDPDFKNYPEQQRIRIANAIEEAHAEELVANELTKQRAIQKKIYDEYIQLQAKRDDAMDAAIGNSIELNKAVKEESDELMFQSALIGQTDQERKKAVKTRQAELLLARELAAIDKLKSLDNGQDIAQLQAQAYQRFADRTKNINTEIANDFAEKQLAEYNRISDGLTDAILTGLIEGGKAGRKKLRDLIVAELKKPITIVVKAVVDATLGSFIQSAIGGAGGDALGSFAGSATGSAATGGISGLSIGGATLGAQAGAFGQGVASGFSFGAPVSSMGGATSGAFNMGATYGAPVAGALAGVYGGRAVSGGYSAMGGSSGNTAVNVGTTAGAIIGSIVPGLGTALGAALGGLAGGAFNRIFGRKLTDVGIRGTLGGETGFEGERYTFEKGGLFRSNKTTPSLLEEADRSAIASDFRLIKGSVMELAETAGFGSDALKDFTASFQINLKDLSPEEAIKKYQEEFTKVEESMAKAVVGSSSYRRENETNLQTLVRLSSFIGGINDAFKKLGFETYKLELGSLDAAQSFIDLFGGIENFSKAMGFFYDNFFTQEEKLTNLSKDLTTEFSKLNLTLPKTREEFKQMVITAQKAGDTVLVKNLTDLQYAFADLVPAAENAAESIVVGVESINDAYNKLKSSAMTAEDIAKQRIDLEQKLFEATATTMQLEADKRNAIDKSNLALYDQIKAAEAVKTTSDNLTKAQDNVVKVEKELTKARSDSLSSFISATKGYIDSLRKFSQSLLLGNLSPLTPEKKYAESGKQLRDLLKIATGSATTPEEIAVRDKALSQLEGAASSFLEASRVYNASSSQYTQDVEFIQQAFLQTADLLDSQVSDAQQQLSVLGSIDTGISDLEKAIKDLALAQQAFNAAVLAGNAVGLKDATSAAAASVLGSSAGLTSAVISNGTLYGIQGDQDPSLPAFAQGTNYVPDDMYAKIHKGERIVPAADNTRLFQSLNDRNETNVVLVTEIRNLRQEIVELREQQSKETATIVVSNIDAQQRNADSINTAISETSKENNWNSKVRESVKLK